MDGDRSSVDTTLADGTGSSSDMDASSTTVACGLTTDSDEYFSSYEDLEVHRLMVGDTSRTEAYRDAILANPELFRNKLVMDIGAGTGILSLFAAQAGARKVYAVEASGLHVLARQNVAKNGATDVVEVLAGRVEDITLDVKVDVIISEWMGFYLLHESMLASVIVGRDRFLKEDGVMLPCVARLYACPSSLASFHADHLKFWERPFGVDMSAVAEASRRSMQQAPQVLETHQEELLANPELLHELHLQWVTCEELETISCRRFSTVTRDGPYRGLCLWFSCEFPGGSVLDTSPSAPATHWKHTAVVLPRDYPVSQQEVVGYEVTLSRSEDNPRSYCIALNMLGEDDEHPVPCRCARGKCRLIKALMDKEDDEFDNVGD